MKSYFAAYYRKQEKIARKQHNRALVKMYRKLRKGVQ